MTWSTKNILQMQTDNKTDTNTSKSDIQVDFLYVCPYTHKHKDNKSDTNLQTRTSHLQACCNLP